MSDYTKSSDLHLVFDTFKLSSFVTLSLVLVLLLLYHHHLPKILNLINGSKARAAGKLAGLPQPPYKLPLIGHLHYLSRSGEVKFQTLVSWARNCGPVFKIEMIRQEFVMLNSPAMVQKLLSSANPHHLGKHRYVYDKVLVGWLGQSLVGAEYERWHSHRKILSRSFTYKAFQNYLVNMNSHTRKLISNLQETVSQCEQSGGYPPINEMIHRTIFDFVSYNIWDIEICAAEESEIFHRAIQRGKEIISIRLTYPFLLVKPLWELHPLSRELRGTEEASENFFLNVLNRYKAKRQAEDLPKKKVAEQSENEEVGAKTTRCMIEELLDAGMPDQAICEEVLAMLIAGYETTSQSVSFLLLMLAMHPDIQRRCQQEIDRVFESKPKNNETLSLDFEDLSNLKYLERCIYENLRLHPIFPIILRALEGPLKIDEDLELDAGTAVVICPYALHRNPEVYPEPEKFDPDRFLPERVASRSTYAFIPFSAGPRNCIGWKQGLLSIKLVATWILRHYDVHTTHTRDSLKFDLQVTMTLAEDLNLTLKRRV